MKKLLVILMFLGLSCCSYAAMVDSPIYMIGAGDALEIHAWNNDNPDILVVNPVSTTQGSTIVTNMAQDTHTVVVSRDGRIYVPLVGVIKVEGISTADLENVIKKGLANYASDANVTVLIKSPKPVKVYMVGQVNRPGMYGVPDGNPEECRIANFINLAGGLSPLAELNRISIKRGTETLYVDFYKLEKEGDVSQNIILRDGDTVVIPQKYNVVYVLGYVLRPGPVRFIEGAGVSDYIGNAGGFTRFAATDNIGIVRGDAQKQIVLKVKVNKYLAWESESDNPKILPGDIIYVSQSWFADWADMSGILIGFRDTRNAARDIISAPQWDTNVDR